MIFQALIVLLPLISITACNDDVSSNRRNEPNNQPITPETVTTISGIHRERGTRPVTYKAEIGVNSEAGNLRAIPDMRLDDDGVDGVNVSHIKVRPDKLCGLVIKDTLKDKIADCLAKNGDKSKWSGTENAGSAESTWVLVTFAEKDNGSEKYEVWLDQRTGMLWSEMISAEGNWCEASGSNLPKDDVVGIDCAITGKGKSLCTNHNPLELPKVSWRLPSRHDYLQADIDGIRFVLPTGNNGFWTATTSTSESSKLRNKAWTYIMSKGTLIAEQIDS